MNEQFAIAKKLAERYRSILQGEGYAVKPADDLNDESETAYVLKMKYEQAPVLMVFSGDDPQFVSMVIPGVFPAEYITAELMASTVRAINTVNANTKTIKLTIREGEKPDVNVAVEFFDPIDPQAGVGSLPKATILRYLGVVRFGLDKFLQECEGYLGDN